MRISRLSGMQCLKSFQTDIQHRRPPVLVFLLWPQLSTDDFDEICRHARAIDKMTGNFVLIILFWVGKRGQPSSAPSDDSELTERLIEGDLSPEDLHALRRGVVDEAYEVATALQIPYSELPCTVVFDDPSSSAFHQIAVDTVAQFIEFTTSLTDFLRKNFRRYFEVREQLGNAERVIERAVEQTTSGNSGNRLRRAERAAAQAPEARQILENAMSDLNTFGEQTRDARKMVSYLMKNPRDQVAHGKLKSQMEAFGLPPITEALARSITTAAEIATFGAPIAVLRQRRDSLEAELSKLPRASIESFMRKQTIGRRLRAAGELASKGSSKVKTVAEVLEKLFSIAKTVSSWLPGGGGIGV